MKLPTVAVKAADFTPAATKTLPGIVTTELLLVNATLNPLAGAAAVSVTVHASVPAPDIVPIVQEIALTAVGATPVPPKFTAIVPCDDVLAIDNVPKNALAC